MVKREIAEELARIACAGHDNRLTRWVGRAGHSSSPSSGLGNRRHHRQRTGSSANSHQSTSSSSGDTILPLHLDLPPEFTRQHVHARKGKASARFVPIKHYQKEVRYNDLRGFFGGIVPFLEPGPAEWTWITEPRKNLLFTERLNGDIRFFDTWIVQDTETDRSGKPYVHLRSPNTDGLASVSVEYLKFRWNGFQDKDQKDGQQKELMQGKAFVLMDHKRKLDDAEKERWKARNEAIKQERKRRRSSSDLTGAA